MQTQEYRYFPYLRGKQFELIALRESATLLSESGFAPIIEPVRQSLVSLDRTIDTLSEQDTKSIIVLNPEVGDFCDNNRPLLQLFKENYSSNHLVTPAIILTENIDVDLFQEVATYVSRSDFTVIHTGADNFAVTDWQKLLASTAQHVFIDRRTSAAHRKTFSQKPCTILRDSFRQMRNADYPDEEFFSDLHVSYSNIKGISSYGDFNIVGDNYSETGGPAYAVAIHLTFIDPERNNEMWVSHFKSDDNYTPVNPAGKFAQAVRKLVNWYDEHSSIFETDSVRKFRELHNSGHFPGLGFVKKLSIEHHFEVLAHFHKTES